jgi:hypothetical protein
MPTRKGHLRKTKTGGKRWVRKTIVKKPAKKRK